MGNKSSNFKSKDLSRKLSDTDSFIRYGNLTTRTVTKPHHPETTDDFVTMDDPKYWTPTNLTPSKIRLLTAQLHCPATPPPTKQSFSSNTTRTSSFRPGSNNTPTSSSYSGQSGQVFRTGNSLMMTPFVFPRSRGQTHLNLKGEGEDMAILYSSKINLINKPSLSRLHSSHLARGDDKPFGPSITSSSTRNSQGPGWLPHVRTSEAQTNLRKKSPKSSIFNFARKSSRFKFKGLKKKSSPSSPTKLKYTLKPYKSKQNIRSRSLTLKKSLEIHIPSSTILDIDKAGDTEVTHQGDMAIVTYKGPPGGPKNSEASVLTKDSRDYSPDQHPDDDYTTSYSYEYSYTYSKTGSSVQSAIKNKKPPPKKKPAKKQAKKESSDGTPTSSSKSTGTTTPSSSTKTSKINSGTSSSAYNDTSESPSSEKSPRKPPPRRPKKFPPPPVFISPYGGGGGGKKKDETPADRLKNVDIVEELSYNCPGDDGCNQCECTLDYYCCCNECGEMELVPHCCCTSKKPGNPVKYCRRQRFNFDDGKKQDECDGGPPYSWEDRQPNPYDEIPVGKNPIVSLGSGSGGSGCCYDTSTVSGDKNSCCEGQVLPSHSGTYFFDAERKCFVPVVEVRKPPPPPPPEVVDEIIEDEPILTNVEPIIQPVIQPMGGMGGCCGPCGMPGGCPMPFFGAMGGRMCFQGPDTGNDKKKRKGKGKKGDNCGGMNTTTMDNVGMMGLCGMNMNGLANMGPYGSIAMPIHKYHQKPPTPPPMPQCPCGPCPCQPPYQPMTNCCNPICFPGYPMYPPCNPYFGGKCKKSKKDKKKKNSDNTSSVQTNTTVDSSTSPSGGNSKTTEDYEDEDD